MVPSENSPSGLRCTKSACHMLPRRHLLSTWIDRAVSQAVLPDFATCSNLAAVKLRTMKDIRVCFRSPSSGAILRRVVWPGPYLYCLKGNPSWYSCEVWQLWSQVESAQKLRFLGMPGSDPPKPSQVVLFTILNILILFLQSLSLIKGTKHVAQSRNEISQV